MCIHGGIADGSSETSYVARLEGDKRNISETEQTDESPVQPTPENFLSELLFCMHLRNTRLLLLPCALPTQRAFSNSVFLGKLTSQREGKVVTVLC